MSPDEMTETLHHNSGYPDFDNNLVDWDPNENDDEPFDKHTKFRKVILGPNPDKKKLKLFKQMYEHV